MKKFFVLFCIPAQAIQDWMTNVDEATRKEQTDKMMSEWQAWLTAHQDIVIDRGLPLGKTKRVDAGGVTDTKNDLNYYIVVNAESHEAAADLFKDHPHVVSIPSAYVEVIDSSRPGM